MIMKLRKNKLGFTLAEVLIVVAIISILAGIALVAVWNYQRSLHQLEMDGTAKEIFVAAQNHLSAAAGQGYLGLSSSGSEGSDGEQLPGSFGNEEGDGIYYFIVSSASDLDKDDVLSLMLPFASVDETVRLGGNYIIRYQREPALVLDVFYSNRTGRFNFNYTNDLYNTLISSYRGDEKKMDRRNYNGAVLGYYGGVEAQRLEAIELKQPSVIIHNANTLTATVTDPNYGKAGASLRLIIEGKSGGAKRVIELTGTLPGYITNNNGEYTVTLDDITRSGMHFAQLFEKGDDGTTLFIPGEDIRLTVESYSNSALAVSPPAVSAEDNSLFGRDTSADTADIRNIRHLENLSPAISAVSYGGAAVRITKANQSQNLDWNSFDKDVLDYNNTAASGGKYIPVDASYGLEYNGNGLDVANVVIDCSTDAGMFGSLTGAYVRNVVLKDFSVKTSNGSAGALAGGIQGTTVSGVFAHNTGSAASATVTGTNNAGGLVGSVIGGRVEKSAAALVVNGSDNSGGLIGYASNATVASVYSGGHTTGARYTTDYNVTSDGNAGGLIGSATGVTLSNSYSTCSAFGETAGGLIGAVEGGSVSNTYAVGLVSGTVKGSVAGTVTGTVSASDNRFLELVNYGVSAVGTGSLTASAIDESLDTYNAFVNYKAAGTSVAYDSELTKQFAGQYYLKTVSDYDSTATASFLTKHYGDWQPPETLVINPDSLKTAVSNPGGAPASGISHVTVRYPESANIPQGSVLTATALGAGAPGYGGYLRSVGSYDSVSLLDISILSENTEIQPQDTVTVELELTDRTPGTEYSVIHFGRTVEPVAALTVGNKLVFKTDGFSVYAVAQTVVEKQLTASDGNEYLFTVTYDKSSGIPDNAELAVSELTVGDEGYAEYVAQSTEKLGAAAEEVVFARAFDIALRDPATGEEYQPDESVKVSIRLLRENLDGYPALDVVHFHGEADGESEIMESSINDGAVEFATDGFSVYVIVAHEGGEIVTPRVEFHFLSHEFTEVSGSAGTYSADPFYFVNKKGTEQNSQIVISGETLEMISNPPNIETTGPDPNDPGKTVTTSKYFFGWYIVNATSADASGSVNYTWTDDPEQLLFEKAITIDPDKIVWANSDHTAITSFVWELNGVEHEVKAEDNGENRIVLDDYGCAHVYLAPIYQDYYFINFYAGTEGTELGDSILTRKLVVLGFDGKADVRIGDVQASSPDARHKIFTGWEGDLWQEDSYAVTRQTMTTLDDVGEEINTDEDRDGFYVTVDSHDLYPGKMSVDLYPIFTEVRWFKFVTGGAHNGATYVGDKYLYTTEAAEDINNGTANYYLTDMPISARTGYRFKGWFADAEERDSNGDYIDGVQITDENGHIVNTAYTKYAEDGVTPLYVLKDGRLYVFKDADAELGVTLYAHWEEITDATIQVIVWRQKVSDSKNSYDHQKKYDFEASYSIDTTSGLTLNDLLANGVLQAENRDLDPNNQSNPNRTDLSYTGFHFRTTTMNTAAVRGDGSTVVNVYYDRDLMTIYYYYNSTTGEPAYIYTETSNDNPEEQYGIVEGEYVRLTRKQGSGMKYNFRYAYQQTTSDTILPQYALVSQTGGVKLYEELTREVHTVYNTRWMFETGNFWQRTTRYMDQGKTDNKFYLRGDFNWRRMDWNYYDSGLTLNNPPPYNDGVTYYCKYNNRYYELTPQTTTTTTYTWKLDGDTYTGTRYRRMAGTEEYTGDLYTVSGYPGETFGVDSRGGYVELNGTQISAYQWFTTTHVEGYFLDNDNNGTQQDVYGLVDGNYVKLTPSFGDTYTYRTANTYTASTADDAVWGLVDGEYVPLTRHQSYSYNQTGYTYTYAGTYNAYGNNSGSNSGTQYGVVDGAFKELVYEYFNYYGWRWAYYDNGYYLYNGYRYTRSNSGSNAYTGTLYSLISGTAGNNESGFTQTDAETGDNLYGRSGNNYFQLRVTDNSYYTLADGTRYNSTRYAQGPGADWSGDRYTRSGDAAPYTYTAHTENPSTGLKLYVVDGNNGHVALNWSVDVSGYTYEDVDGNVQPYTGDRYSFQSGEVETEYTGTRYTRATRSGYSRMLMYTGLYGQTLEQAGYTWPDTIDGTNYIWRSGTSSNSSRLTFLDAFLFADLGYATNNNTVLTLYGSATSQSGTYIYFYKQNLDGTYPATGLAGAANVIPTTSGGTFTFTNKYNGFELDTYSTNNGGSWNTANVDGSASISNSGLHIRFKRISYDLIFEPNYPTAAGTTVAGEELTLDNLQEKTDANTVTENVPFETPLSEYSGQPQPTQGPDNYIFEGWYEDDTGTKRFDFDEPMPAANMRLYAKWTPVKFRIRIDPNGGQIDHVNYNAAAAGTYTYTEKGYSDSVSLSLGDYGVNDSKTGYNQSNATFFNTVYNETVTEYTNIERKFVPISDVAAELLEDSEVYYYVNTQYMAGYDLEPDLRNALYVIESELDDYYEFYRTWVQYKHDLTDDLGRPLSNPPLDFETWKETYLTKNASGGYQKYRKTTGTEEYKLLGWYRLDANGDPEPMPYNFSDPVRAPMTLRAYWRLAAGYQIRYHADYTMDDGAIINGSIPYWTDPEIDSARYTDEAATHIYRQPTGITRNNVPTTEYIFRGWQLVDVSTNDQGQVVYTPIEPGVYYDPGDDFTVHAAYADRASVIHMQAVYEEKDSSYRRPYVTNLALNANGGFITLDGENELTANTDLSDTWDGVIGTVAATVTTSAGDTELIEFGDIQSNKKVQLYRYAADIDHVDGDSTKAELDPAGKNYFKHPDNYFLLGFDDGSNEGDFVATYPADSVIGVQRNEPKDSRTKYAVWEPMVYVKVVNATDVGAVTFGLSSSEGALQVVNAREGLFGRTPMTAEELSSITVENGDYIWLAVPYGVVKEIVDGNEVVTKRHITIEGTNDLGPGWLLSASSEFDGQARSTLTGSLTNTNADYTSVQNLKPFGFNEQLEIDPKGEGIIITFTAIQNPHTLVLDDNYPDVGVRTQEVYFDNQTNAATPPYGYDVVYGENQTLYYDLPSTSTRVGYVFLGWDSSPTWMADHPNYKTSGELPFYTTNSASGWRIANLTDFFKDAADPNELDSVKTLYAVWDTSAESKIVYVYKEVPEPGDQEKPFTFTVALSGLYDYSQYSSGWGGGTTTNRTNNPFTATGNGTFTLKHGEYLRIESAKVDSGSGTWRPSITTVIQKYDQNDVAQGNPVTLSWTWTNSVNSSGTYRSFTFHDLSYTVTETDYSAAPHYYDTEMTCTALASDTYPLMLGSTPAAIDSLPLEHVAGRVLSWTNTEAGGRVIFTNTRQTADVTVKKNLVSSSSVPGVFNFTASYTLESETTDLGSFTVTSGTEGKKLEDIPVGATLTVTELGGNLDDYTTTVTQGSNTLPVTETTEGATYKRTVNYTVTNQDTDITYTNTLKSYPITFYMVDQDGNAGVPSYFRLASSTGLIAEQLYPAQTGTGEFFPGTTGQSNRFYVGTYTLTETFIGSEYLPLDGPVTLTLSADGNGKLESSNEDYLKIERVSASDPTQGFKVYVYGQKIVTLSIKKVLSDPILTSTRRFNFRVQYEYTLLGNTVTYDNFDTSKDNNGLLSIRSGASEEIKVPVNAKLTVSEILTAADAELYDTSIVRTYKDGEEVRTDAEVGGTIYRYGSDSGSNHGIVLAENNNDILTFTNKRKVVNVTVKKLVESQDGDNPNAKYFTFKATLLNGGIAIGNYHIDLSGDGLNTNGSGEYVFTLEKDGHKTLSIPRGARLTIQEIAASSTSAYDNDVGIESYSASVSAVFDDSSAFTQGSFSEEEYLYDINPVPTRALTVTFTNGAGGKDVTFRKIDGFGAAKAGARFAVYDSYPHAAAAGTTGRVKVKVGDSQTEVVTSDASGNVSFTVRTGTWYIREITTLPGCKTNTNVYRLSVGAAGTVVNGVQLPAGKEFLIERMSAQDTVDTSLNVEKYGVLNESLTERKVILKKIAENYAQLGGAKFTIYRVDMTVFAETAVSDADNGAFFVGSLPYGVYYLKETQAPTGYKLPNDNQYFKLTVTENGAVFDDGLVTLS